MPGRTSTTNALSSLSPPGFSFSCTRPVFPPVSTAAYVSDELKAAALVEEELDPEESRADGEPSAKHACPEKEPSKACASYQDSPAVEFSSHDLDSESHISEASDRMADFESGSVKNEEETKEGAGAPEDAPVPDSLEQMKAVYNNFLSNSYWSNLSLNLHHHSGTCSF